MVAMAALGTCLNTPLLMDHAEEIVGQRRIQSLENSLFLKGQGRVPRSQISPSEVVVSLGMPLVAQNNALETTDRLVVLTCLETGLAGTDLRVADLDRKSVV